MRLLFTLVEEQCDKILSLYVHKKKIDNSIILSLYKAKSEENVHVWDLVIALGTKKIIRLFFFIIR